MTKNKFEFNKEKELLDSKNIEDYGKQIIDNSNDKIRSVFKIGDIVEYDDSHELKLYRIYDCYLCVYEFDHELRTLDYDFYYKFYPFDCENYKTIEDYTGIRYFESKEKNKMKLIYDS